MTAIIVSIMETFKRRNVSKLDLHPAAPCRIFQFMKHDRRLGALVRKLRARKGATVQQLADVLNIEKGTMSKKERGESSFDDSELDTLASYFKMPSWKLFALAAGVEPERLDFSDAYDVVTPGFREDILKMVQERQGDVATDK